MALKAVFFDVGETLVDEERWWRELAERSGLQPHVVWAALGVTIARGEEHDALWDHLGIGRPGSWWQGPRTRTTTSPGGSGVPAKPSRRGLPGGDRREPSAALEQWARQSALEADVISSSESLGVRKPDPQFFAKVVELGGVAASEVAYVGDRVDDDVLPAAQAGLVAVHVRRGPWGRLQRTSHEASVGLDDLASFPGALASLA